MSWFRSRVSKPGDLYCRALCIPWRFPFSCESPSTWVPITRSFHIIERALTHSSTHNRNLFSDCLPESIKAGLRVALRVSWLTCDEIHCHVCDCAHDCSRERWLILERSAGHAVAQHLL